MAFPSPSRPCCPIRIVSVHLLDAAGQLLRVLFLDRERHITSQPHYVPRAEALILRGSPLPARRAEREQVRGRLVRAR